MIDCPRFSDGTPIFPGRVKPEPGAKEIRAGEFDDIASPAIPEDLPQPIRNAMAVLRSQSWRCNSAVADALESWCRDLSQTGAA